MRLKSLNVIGNIIESNHNTNVRQSNDCDYHDDYNDYHHYHQQKSTFINKKLN